MNREVPNLKSEIRNPKSEIRNPNSAVDELLSSFFQSEMPQPWPASFARSRIEDEGSRIEDRGSKIASNKVSILNPPSSILDLQSSSLDSRSSIINARRSFRSRWVLAASVAILLMGSWWLGQRFAALEPNISPTSSGKMIGSKLEPGKNKPPRHSWKNVLN
jgi:hypothetical protein